MYTCRVLMCPPQRGRLHAEARLFHALADPTRLAILRALCSRPMKVVELCRFTGRAQPNVSAHLACLKESGLVEGDVQGRQTVYRVLESELAAILCASEKVVDRNAPPVRSCRMVPRSSP